jgi:hypothetical protein
MVVFALLMFSLSKDERSVAFINFNFLFAFFLCVFFSFERLIAFFKCSIDTLCKLSSFYFWLDLQLGICTTWSSADADKHFDRSFNLMVEGVCEWKLDLHLQELLAHLITTVNCKNEKSLSSRCCYFYSDKSHNRSKRSRNADNPLLLKNTLNKNKRMFRLTIRIRAEFSLSLNTETTRQNRNAPFRLFRL